MATAGLRRTDYWNRVTGSVRAGDTRRDETVTDVESFLIPYLHAASAGLHLWGVGDGLTVSAALGQAGVQVSPGSAMDSSGRPIVLHSGGQAVTDPNINPDDVANIGAVAVDDNGVSAPTAGLNGKHYVVIRYLEAVDGGLVGNAPALVHAPWVRLVAAAGFADGGTDVVLAQVDLAAGAVGALDAGLRRHTGVAVDRLQLRRPATTAGPAAAVTHTPAAELRARSDGGLSLDLLGAPTVTALTIGPTGSLGVGLGDQPAQRPIHSQGTVHSGGSQGGFSFADRNVGSLVEDPTAAGERWMWYAQGGEARLWSGVDVLTVNRTPPGSGPGLDVRRRIRVRQGGDYSSGIWFHQDVPNADCAFVGMADDTHVGFWGQVGGLWGVLMDTTNGSLRVAPHSGTPAALTVDGLTALNGRTTIYNGITVNMPSRPVNPNFPQILFPFPRLPAGQFNGNVNVTGTFTAGQKQFTIDHPLDPANKLLHHSSIESDELKNIYDGVAELDARGCAEVQLPEWFEALNEQFRYQLTPIGGAAPDLHVAAGLHDNRFAIAGGTPDSAVCWQVSGVRHDAYAQAHPLEVESLKPEHESGHFLHPEEHQEPAELAIARLYEPQDDSTERTP